MEKLSFRKTTQNPKLLMGRVFPVLRTFPIRVHPFVAVRCDSSSLSWGASFLVWRVRTPSDSAWLKVHSWAYTASSCVLCHFCFRSLLLCQIVRYWTLVFMLSILHKMEQTDTDWTWCQNCLKKIVLQTQNLKREINQITGRHPAARPKEIVIH